MTKIVSFLFSLMFCMNIAIGQEPVITMTTSHPTGTVINLQLGAHANNTAIQVDFGDGNKVDKTIGTLPITISDTLVMTQTIKIYGTGITYFSCNSNKITSVDVSKNSTLAEFFCNFNQITTLDVTKNTGLKVLSCETNKLTSLDVTNNTALTKLHCSYNQIDSLDVAKNILLTHLTCAGNQLTSLDVTKNTGLSSFSCAINQLTSLDITKNTALSIFSCNDNKLTSLDVTKNTVLYSFKCNVNQLTSLDISNNTALSYFNCNNNQLTSLNLSNNTALAKLYCYGNKLTALSLTQNTLLTELECGYNPISSLDVTQNTALTSLSCFENKLTSLDVTRNTQLTHLTCSRNQLSSLDVTNNFALKYLACNINKLTALDVTGNTALTVLHCFSNQLTFVTLPHKQTTWTTFNCVPQNPISIAKDSKSGNELDLSDQFFVHEDFTVFAWKTQNDAILVKGTDYTIIGGKTIFLNPIADSVYCEMTNPAFPDFTGQNVLKTTCTYVSLASAIEKAEKQKVGLDSYNKILYVKLPYNAQLSVFDTNGRLIVLKPLYNGINSIELINSGIYLVRIAGDSEIVSRKIFIE